VHKIDNGLIGIIKELYADNRIYVTQRNRLSQPICSLKNVRQSCGLSLLPFNIYLKRDPGENGEEVAMGIPVDKFTLIFSVLRMIRWYLIDTYDIEFMLK